MNFIKSILLSLALISTSFAEPIKDMFGVSFGDKFDVTKGIKVKTLFRDDLDVYQFVPSIPYRAFVTYYVMITPKTHIIYGIYAKSSSESNHQLLIDEEKLIKIIILKKYGMEPFYAGFITNIKMKAADGDTLIYNTPVKHTHLEYTLELVYRNQYFAQQAIRERDELTLEAAKVDSSGL